MRNIDNIFNRPQVQRGFARATRILGEEITIGDKPYTAIVNELRVTREMADAGYDPGYNLTAFIPLAQMPELPPMDKEPVFARYKGREYRIKDPAAIDAVGVTLYLQNNF